MGEGDKSDFLRLYKHKLKIHLEEVLTIAYFKDESRQKRGKLCLHVLQLGSSSKVRNSALNFQLGQQ